MAGIVSLHATAGIMRNALPSMAPVSVPLVSRERIVASHAMKGGRVRTVRTSVRA